MTNEADTARTVSHAFICCFVGMAGGHRQQGGAAPLPQGPGATDLLPEK